MRLTKSIGKICFLIIRQQKYTIQGVLTVDEDKISKGMVKFASG